MASESQRRDTTEGLSTRDLLEVIGRWLDTCETVEAADPPLSRHLTEIQSRADTRLEEATAPLLAEIDDLAVEVQRLGPDADGMDRARVAARAHAVTLKLAAALQVHATLQNHIPGNPVRFIQSDGRLYLDVTDATREQVNAAWPLVEREQRVLCRQGSSRKRGAGNPQKIRSGDVQRWVDRANKRGEPRAYAEYKADYTRRCGQWTPGAYQWWYKRVRPHVR